MILTDVLMMPLLGVLIHMNKSYILVSSIYYLYRPEILCQLKIKSYMRQKDLKSADCPLYNFYSKNELDKLVQNWMKL